MAPRAGRSNEFTSNEFTSNPKGRRTDRASCGRNAGPGCYDRSRAQPQSPLEPADPPDLQESGEPAGADPGNARWRDPGRTDTARRGASLHPRPRATARGGAKHRRPRLRAAGQRGLPADAQPQRPLRQSRNPGGAGGAARAPVSAADFAVADRLGAASFRLALKIAKHHQAGGRTEVSVFVSVRQDSTSNYVLSRLEQIMHHK